MPVKCEHCQREFCLRYIPHNISGGFKSFQGFFYFGSLNAFLDTDTNQTIRVLNWKKTKFLQKKQAVGKKVRKTGKFTVNFAIFVRDFEGKQILFALFLNSSN